MHQKLIVLLGLGSTMLGCQHLEKKTRSPLALNVSELQEPLTTLVQNMYRWKETQAKQGDFLPKEDPTSKLYVGLDVEEHQKRLHELQSSGFFTSVFLEQYHAHAIQIHTALLEGKPAWQTGYQAPFESGIDPWCRCQDTPDRYWEHIQIVDIRPEGDSIRILWSWGNGFTYLMRAEHTENGMKIRYMEGLDSAYTPISSAY